MTSYIAVVEKEDDTAFGIWFPDLPGCISAADDEGEIYENAAIALRLYADGEMELAAPSAMTSLSARPDVRKAVKAGAILISVPLIQSTKKRRYNVMLDPALVEHVDEMARIAGVSRSELIADALEARLKRSGAFKQTEQA